LALNLVGRTTVRSLATAIGRGLEPLDVRTDPQTRLNLCFFLKLNSSSIKKIKKSSKNSIWGTKLNFLYCENKTSFLQFNFRERISEYAARSATYPTSSSLSTFNLSLHGLISPTIATTTTFVFFVHLFLFFRDSFNFFEFLSICICWMWFSCFCYEWKRKKCLF
jgi:hypothetical protein